MEGMTTVAETPLTTLRPGDEGAVTSVLTSESSTRRLAELGVRLGAHVTVVQRAAGRSIVLVVAGSKLALDAATAAAIRVSPVVTP